ncbi:MAG TPA: histidine phosphatase family protein [Pirellulales bacterium]|jgi:probable phosphoglycerate mutase|nr:histidine phosphatase family protein [Pirellulales bacterium]
MLLYFIRHGESLFNAQRRIQGQSDVALSPTGLRQAAALAAALGSIDAEAIYASPLRRAMQTAEPLAAALHLTVRTDDRLKEINAGEFQGLEWPEIEQRWPDAASHWQRQTPDFVIPGGESRRAVAERGQAAFEAIRAAGHRTAVVVAHGGVLSGALRSLLQIPAQMSPFSFFNAAINKLTWDQMQVDGEGETPRTRIKILVINETGHLKAAGLNAENHTGDL